MLNTWACPPRKALRSHRRRGVTSPYRSELLLPSKRYQLFELKDMIERQYTKFYPFLNARRVATAAALPLDSQLDSPTLNDHKFLCFSLLESLLRRGLLLSAQQLIHRIILSSSAASEALSAVNFVVERGLELDFSTYGTLIGKLVRSGEYHLAEKIYYGNFNQRGIQLDSSILNSMVICLFNLGKHEEAREHFDRLLSLNCVPTELSFTLIFRQLCNQGKFLEAFEYLVAACEAGLCLRFWCFNVLMDGLCYKGHVDEAFELFDMMRCRNKCSPTLHMCKTLFYALCKRGCFVEAESLFEEMESKGLYIDKMMYTSLIHVYCKDKKMKMAMRVFLRMLKTKCEPDNYVFNTLLYGFVKLGMLDKSCIIHNQMSEWGYKPDCVTYHIIIHKQCKEGKVDCGLMVLENMISCNIKPSAHCYTVLIDALFKEKRVEKANELFQKMLDYGGVPDHVLFFTLMKNIPKGREVPLALSILQAIFLNGCGFDPSMLPVSDNLNYCNVAWKFEVLLEKISNSSLDLAKEAFAVAISALCEVQERDTALYFLEKMEGLGCKPLIFTYNSLIKSLCKEGLFNDVTYLISHMRDCSVIPNLATYLIIINEYCKNGDLDSAFDILDQIKQEGLRPNVAIYASIISSLARRKRMDDAESIFMTMIEGGVDPDENVFMTMINGYSKNGKLAEANELFEIMKENSIKPSSYSYTTLISGLVKKNMIEAGCKYLKRMLEDGLLPNIVLYTALINHFLKNKDVVFAFQLVDLMERSQIKRDLVLYIVLVSSISRCITVLEKRCLTVNRVSEKEKMMLFSLLHERNLAPKRWNSVASPNSLQSMKHFALELIQKVKNLNLTPNLYLYNVIICGFCKVGRTEEAYEQLESMKKEGIRPNHVTLTILMDERICAGDFTSAIGLYNKMIEDGYFRDRIAYKTLHRGLYEAGMQLDGLSIPYLMCDGGSFSKSDILRLHS